MNQKGIKKLTLKVFPQAEYLHWILVDTPIYIIEKKAPDGNINFYKMDYVCFNFLDNKIIWLNNEIGTKGGHSATIIYPYLHEHAASLTIGKRFLSYLASKEGFPFAEFPSRSPQKNGKVICVHSVYEEGCTLRLKKTLEDGASPKDFSGKYWVALAHNREFLNSRSVYYKYLSCWKILELACDNKTSEINKFIQNNTDDKNAELWSCRQKSAHFMAQSKKSAYEDPDNPLIYNYVQRNIPLIIQLKDMLLANPSLF